MAALRIRTGSTTVLRDRANMKLSIISIVVQLSLIADLAARVDSIPVSSAGKIGATDVACIR